MDNLTFRNNFKLSMETVYTFLYSLELSMENVTVCMETVYNSSNSMSSTRNLNENRKKSIAKFLVIPTKKQSTHRNQIYQSGLRK